MDYVNGPSTGRIRHPLTSGNATRVFTARTGGTNLIRLTSDRSNSHDIAILFTDENEVPTATDVLNFADYYLVGKDTYELEVQPKMNVYATVPSGGTATLIAKEVYVQG